MFAALLAAGALGAHSVPAVEPVAARNGMVVSQHYLATEAGLQVLKEGGNAVDAAVTVGFVEAVVLPAAGNLGGGGFMLAHLAEKDSVIAIDFREKAPAAATRDMFLDSSGNPDPEQSQYSYRAAGVPGTVAGLALALERYGTIPLTRALKPAIELAEKGFRVDSYLHGSLVSAKRRMEACPASMAIFFKPDGSPWEIGERLVQKDLARSLRKIEKLGPRAFYQGSIAEKIASDMAAHGGLITREDLASYRPAVRKPVRGTYRGYEIVSMPPPSSGGVHLIQMLNLLEGWPAGLFGHNTPETIGLMAECMKRAYADRSLHLGDPDFVKVPVDGLTSKRYADALRAAITQGKATPSADIRPGNPGPYESAQTTHYSTADRFGNAVAVTYTLNFSYGAGLTAAGTGILLNDEMDDFSAKPGTPNGFGLLGGDANAIEPNKRMLSSMTPTIVLKDGEVFLVTGSPGGSRIITTTLQILLNVIDHGMNIADATNAPRVHHQWMPDELVVEKVLDESMIQKLAAMGYTVKTVGSIGCTQSIMRVGGMLYGAADMRGSSSLAEGY
jgi:gamma-glutamyltranspeptidase/glutathione hydrolase